MWIWQMFPLIGCGLRIFSGNVTGVTLCSRCVYSPGVCSGLSHYWRCSFWSLSEVVSAYLLHCNNISFFPNDINGWAFCGQVLSKYLSLHQISSYSFISLCKEDPGYLFQFDAQTDPEVAKWELLQAGVCAFHTPSSIPWGLPIFLARFDAPGFPCPLS